MPREGVVAFGIYTVANDTLKMSAQLFLLYPNESREVRLEIQTDGQWKEIARAQVNDIGWWALFRISDWDASREMRYRLRHGKAAEFEG